MRLEYARSSRWRREVGTLPMSRHAEARHEPRNSRNCAQESSCMVWHLTCKWRGIQLLVRGRDAQPLCKFAMCKTVSSIRPRQAVPCRDGVSRQIGKFDSSVLPCHAATTTARGTLLVVRSVCRGLDTGSRPERRNRVDAPGAAKRHRR